MKREIVCPDQSCQGVWEGMVGKYPGEDVKVVKGTLCVPCICDCCGKGLPEGSAAAAVSVSTSERPYSPWESEYLVAA